MMNRTNEYFLLLLQFNWIEWTQWPTMAKNLWPQLGVYAKLCIRFLSS